MQKNFRLRKIFREFFVRIIAIFLLTVLQGLLDLFGNCHSGASRNLDGRLFYWIPACAGMTIFLVSEQVYCSTSIH